MLSMEDMERYVIRNYSGYIKSVHQVHFDASETRKSYSHPLLDVIRSFVVFEPLASQPMIESRTGRQIVIVKRATEGPETVRMRIDLPDEVIE